MREMKDPGEWWTPVHTEGRFWEKNTSRRRSSGVVDEEVLREVRRNNHDASTIMMDGNESGSGSGEGSENKKTGSGIHTAAKNSEEDGIFRHGASPFRTVAEPPPKFGWQHAWGMMRWGKKAGEWGKGVEGRRFKEKDEGRESEGKVG